MKDTWYGDRPDLVKWGTLIRLAQREWIKCIVQVAFLRKGEKPELQIDSQNYEDICEEVWSHFRDLSSIKSLGESTGLDIEVIDQQWDSKPRQEYVQSVIESLQAKSEKKVVLLDPDTGIEPENARREHVKKAEVSEFWETLNPGDWLVLYQHRSFDKDWQNRTRSKFRCACENKKVETFKVEGITKSVILFAAQKS